MVLLSVHGGVQPIHACPHSYPQAVYACVEIMTVLVPPDADILAPVTIAARVSGCLTRRQGA